MAKDYFIKMDTNIISGYADKVLHANNDLDRFVKSYMHELAGRIMSKAMARTPVAAENGGTLRRSYKVSKVEQKGDILEITVYNDARQDGMDESYASYVEEGHFTRNKEESERYWIEGRWMLTVSTDEVQKDMQKIWNSKFLNWAKQKGL